MSLFGKLDAQNVKSNPFFVEAGTYHAQVTDARYKSFTRKSGEEQRQLIIEYTINEEESAFLDKKVQKFYNLPAADLTLEQFELLPKETQAQINKDMSTLKKDLSGNSANSYQKGLGVPVEDLNDENWNPQVLLGTKVLIGITNFGPDNESVNVRWVNLDQNAE